MANNWKINENGNIVFPVPDKVKIPWDRSRGDLPLTVEYFNGTMYEKVEETAKKHPLMIALDFMGKHITYKYMVPGQYRIPRRLPASGGGKNIRPSRRNGSPSQTP